MVMAKIVDPRAHLASQLLLQSPPGEVSDILQGCFSIIYIKS